MWPECDIHAGRAEIAPHLALWPGVCLTVVVYRLNLFGDAVRDLLDPRLRGRLDRYSAGREKRNRSAFSACKSLT